MSLRLTGTITTAATALSEVSPPSRTSGASCRFLGYVTFFLIVSIFVGRTSAHDMVAPDVSNTTFYRALTAQGRLITDGPHHRTHDSTSLVSRAIGAPGSNNTTDSIPNQTGLPSPFDTSLGNNFTESTCPNFFTSFLQNATFQSCLPISLLLQNSMSFFDTARSGPQLDHTLATSCEASLSVCSSMMSHLAEQMIAPGNCQRDYQYQNPLVMQAYNGFLAYEPVYRATCLKDGSSQRYCFTEAMTNISNPSDVYPYYTAIGLALPLSSPPSCTLCLQQTMQIFSTFAVQKSQPLSRNYLDSASQINRHCGNAFASTEISSKKITNSAVASRAPCVAGGFLAITVALVTSL